MRLVRIAILLLLAVFVGVSKASAQLVGISITVAPPELPVYEQPPIPAPGYIWTPGYWAWDDGDYYWVPGTWVEPPTVGLLWTPGYWGWRDGVYLWNAGYWGPHVGFYGGINYGFGYGGVGYLGGVWRGGVFSYNRTVNNFGSVNITNVYSKTVINNVNVTKVSFNGGTGGTTAKATPAELTASREQHVQPTAAQTQHQQMASTNKELRASVNHGTPTVGGTSHAGRFSGEGVVGAHANTGSGAGGGGNSPGGLNPNHAVGGNHELPGNRQAVGNQAVGNNAPKVNNAALNAHPGGGLKPGPQHPGGGAGYNGPPAGGGTHIVNPPGGFKGGGAPPRIANVARQPPRPPVAARPPAPRPAGGQKPGPHPH